MAGPLLTLLLLENLRLVDIVCPLKNIVKGQERGQQDDGQRWLDLAHLAAIRESQVS